MNENPPPNAFVTAGSFREALNEIRRGAGLQVNNGSVTRMNKGRDIRFLNPPVKTPFLAFGGAASIRINAGVVTYAGKSYLFPEATYNGASGGMVALKIIVEFLATPVYIGPDEQPWAVTIVTDQPPRLVWTSARKTWTHAQIRNPPDTPPSGTEDYTINTLSSEVYFPIAGWSGRRLVQYRTGNISALVTATGSVQLYSF